MMSSLICRQYWRHPWPTTLRNTQCQTHSQFVPFKYSYTHLWRVHLARQTDRQTVWAGVEEQIHWSHCSHCFAHTASSIDSFGLLLTGPAEILYIYRHVICLGAGLYISLAVVVLLSRLSLSPVSERLCIYRFAFAALVDTLEIDDNWARHPRVAHIMQININ